MAGEEIERFRREMIERGEVEKARKITDQDLLREVMNTVGKEGKLGEPIRCVVSVAMLTEGWDANTVTHILGVRAFGTQLLCDQRGIAAGGTSSAATTTARSCAKPMRSTPKAWQGQLRRRGWTEDELRRRRKGDPENVQIARCVREQTTMTLKWIAERLNMGTWAHVSNRLVQRRKENEKCK